MIVSTFPKPCTFQRAVLAALCGTDGGRVTFVYISTRGINGSAWYRRRVSFHFQRAVSAALCGAGGCFCLFLLLNIVYLPIYAKLVLFVGMTKQMSDGKELDILNC